MFLRTSPFYQNNAFPDVWNIYFGLKESRAFRFKDLKENRAFRFKDPAQDVWNISSGLTIYSSGLKLYSRGLKECFKDPAYVHTLPKNNRNVTVFTTSADENLHPANTNSMRDEEKSILKVCQFKTNINSLCFTNYLGCSSPFKTSPVHSD